MASDRAIDRLTVVVSLLVVIDGFNLALAAAPAGKVIDWGAVLIGGIFMAVFLVAIAVGLLTLTKPRKPGPEGRRLRFG